MFNYFIYCCLWITYRRWYCRRHENKIAGEDEDEDERAEEIPELIEKEILNAFLLWEMALDNYK